MAISDVLSADTTKVNRKTGERTEKKEEVKGRKREGGKRGEEKTSYYNKYNGVNAII